jgi:hypothetical protein
MTFRSYRRERMSELREGLKDRNERAAKLMLRYIKESTPVETTTLRNNIDSHVTEEVVDIGFSEPEYGIYVHQGTLDVAHGRGGWTEEQSKELEAWKSAQDRRGGSTAITPPKGLMPRPFLVYGAVQAKPYLRAVYTPIN